MQKYATVLSLAILLVAAACGGDAELRPASTTPTPLTSATASPATSTSVPQSSVAAVATSSAAPVLVKTASLEYAAPNRLDVYAPIEPGQRPVVLVVHGLGQNRSEFAGLAEAIATKGAVVFNISVTFSVPFLDAIEDIACAVRFVRANAAEYGGDATWITIVGNSSGAAKGSIVAMDGDAYEGDCVVTEGSALPDALVGYEGPYDYATRVYGGVNIPAVREEDPELWEAVNPYSHIGGNDDLVVRLIHGRDKDVAWYDVLPEVSAEFHQALAEAGYDVELTYVDGAGHGALRAGTEAFEVTVEQVLEAAHG